MTSLGRKTPVPGGFVWVFVLEQTSSVLVTSRGPGNILHAARQHGSQSVELCSQQVHGLMWPTIAPRAQVRQETVLGSMFSRIR